MHAAQRCRQQGLQCRSRDSTTTRLAPRTFTALPLLHQSHARLVHLRLPTSQPPAPAPTGLPGTAAVAHLRSTIRTAAIGPVGDVTSRVADGVTNAVTSSISSSAGTGSSVLSELQVFLTAAPQLLGSNPTTWFWVLSPVVLGSLTGATGAFTGGYTWYKGLRKPWYNPPDFVFGIAWTVLYILMGLAAYRVYDKVGWPSWALQVYLAQLALNLLWYVIFFDAKKPRTAQLENIAFFILVCYTTYLFFQVDDVAGFLMLPYVAWVAFANFLNLGIIKRN